MIQMPPDGREVIGRRIEGLVHGLNELVTDYLHMLSVGDDTLRGELKVRETILQHPILCRALQVHRDRAPKAD